MRQALSILVVVAVTVAVLVAGNAASACWMFLSPQSPRGIVRLQRSEGGAILGSLFSEYGHAQDTS